MHDRLIGGGGHSMLCRTFQEPPRNNDSSPIRSGFGRKVNASDRATRFRWKLPLRNMNKSLGLPLPIQNRSDPRPSNLNAAPRDLLTRAKPDSASGWIPRRRDQLWCRTKSESMRVSDSSPIRSRVVPRINRVAILPFAPSRPSYMEAARAVDLRSWQVLHARFRV